MKTDMLNTGKKSMSKQDSYISNIEKWMPFTPFQIYFVFIWIGGPETLMPIIIDILFSFSTSYVLFERKSADQNSWVQRKPPPPKPPRTSSVKKMAPLPPPPPTLHFPSPPPSPMDFPSPPPPLTTSSTSLRSAISPLAGEDGYCPMNKQPKRNRPESIPEDEYVYAVPCDVNMEKVKKKKKKTSDSPKAKGLVKPHGKKLPQVPSNESLSSELTKRAAPPVPAKPSHLSKPELAKVRSSEVYANVLSEALSLETPMKGAQSSSEGPVLLRTPAGMFLVTKLNGPLAEVSHCWLLGFYQVLDARYDMFVCCLDSGLFESFVMCCWLLCLREECEISVWEGWACFWRAINVELVQDIYTAYCLSQGLMIVVQNGVCFPFCHMFITTF